MQSALCVYHHLWRVESALELGYNTTRTAHTGENHTLQQEGGHGNECPLSLQRQLRGWLELRKSLQSDIRRRAEAANGEEDWGDEEAPWLRTQGPQPRKSETPITADTWSLTTQVRRLGTLFKDSTKTVSGGQAARAMESLSGLQKSQLHLAQQAQGPPKCPACWSELLP